MKCSCLLLYLSVQLDAPQIVLHCIVYFSTVHTNWLTIYVSAEVMPPSVFSRLCKLLYTKPMLTRNCSVTQQSSRTELYFSSGWIASPATRDCFSWHWILWHLCLSSLCWTVILAVWSDSKKLEQNKDVPV